MIDRRGGRDVTTQAQAVAAAAPIVGRAWADVGRLYEDVGRLYEEGGRLYEEGGPTMVAEAARELGGPSRQEIAAKYEGFVQEENVRDGAGGR